MKHVHEAKRYVKLASRKFKLLDNFTVYPGSLYGRDGAYFWVCDCYKTVNGKLPCHIYDGMFWQLKFIGKDCPIYKWVLSAINQLGKVPEVKREFVNYTELMKHDRRHKKGSGSRIYTNQINGCLKWNEVTEDAHWYGKGNASVVAANIKM